MLMHVTGRLKTLLCCSDAPSGTSRCCAAGTGCSCKNVLGVTEDGLEFVGFVCFFCKVGMGGDGPL